MDMLVALLQAARPPDVDAPNAAGVTVRQLSQAAMDAGEAAAARRRREQEAELQREREGDGGGSGDDDDWRQRLRDEMSDDELGGIGYARYRPGGHDDSFSWPRGLADGDDDAWADRLWEEMRRQQRAAQRLQGLRDAAAALSEAAAAREGRAREAREASDRILGQERAKEANWREAMMRQVAESAMPMRRQEYEAAWVALEARVQQPGGRGVEYRDIPWPTRALRAAGGGAAPAAADDAASRSELQDLVMVGAGGPSDIKKRLRAELMRWHPDKFGARIEPRLDPGDRAAVLAGVRSVAQQLTALMAAPRP